MNQRKCASCGTWNDTKRLKCLECHNLIDPIHIATVEIERKRTELEDIRLAKQTKFEKWFSKFQHSESPVVRGIYFIGSVLVTIYMAIISFFIWMIALISG